MHVSIELVWDIIPSTYTIPFYTIIVCTIGGLIIGIWRKKFGDYPEELSTVITTVKENNNRYEYKNLPQMTVAAILPLIFGGSIGPEARINWCYSWNMYMGWR